MIPEGTGVVSALVAALGVIGLLVKAMLDQRRRSNGQGHVTRAELSAHAAALHTHLDEKAAVLDEKIEKIDRRLEAAVARRSEWASALDVERLYRRVETLEQRRP